MAIAQADFDSEEELEQWAFKELPLFLGDCVSLGKLKIVTPTGKGGIPDGFAFNFTNREWFVLEAELLSHGVWPHIAEQVTRFVVALQSDSTIRKIRDRLFEEVVATARTDEVAEILGVGRERLLQQIELFVEGIQPTIVIFIDETSQDLQDFANALDVPVRIYRVNKFVVDGKSEYYSPDKSVPILETTPDMKVADGVQDIDVISRLGGGSTIPSPGRFKSYRLDDGRIVHIKRSKFHERGQYYWYGIGPSSLQQAEELGVTHFVFVLGEWGFVVVETAIVNKFCSETKVSSNPDGSVRHYHVLISQEPEPELFYSSLTPRYDLSDVAYPFQ